MKWPWFILYDSNFMIHTLWFILYDSVNKWLLSVVSFTWYGNYAFTDLHKLLIDSLNLIFLNFLLNIWIFVKRNILLYNRRTICNSENRHINFPMWISRNLLTILTISPIVLKVKQAAALSCWKNWKWWQRTWLHFPPGLYAD